MPRESIHTKCVWSPMSDDDGLRVLVTRFRGRDMKKNRYDLWLPSLGPSEKLLKRYTSNEIEWEEFGREYLREIWSSRDIDQNNRTIRNHGQKGLLRTLRYLSRRQRVTFLCHCGEDQDHCHRHLLRSFLVGKKVTL